MRSAAAMVRAGGLLLPAMLAACTATRADFVRSGACAVIGARPSLTAHLLLGAQRASGGLVTNAMWRRFLDTRITPRFPAGLTVLGAHGQWRQPDGRLLREPSRVVLIVAPDTAEAVSALEAIRAEYREAFAQEAAGLVISRSCALF